MKNELYQQYCEALKNEASPGLFLDLKAFESNMDWMIKNAGQKKIRVATKSIRSVEVLNTILAYSDVFKGLMTFTLKEALWLRKRGFRDLLMGYPTTDKQSLSELAQDPDGITLMVDLPEHLELLESLNPVKKFSICLDLDLSMDLPGLRFGVYRSAISNEEGVKGILSVLKSSQKIKLSGLMGYEAQIAGVGDAHSALIRMLKHFSVKQLRKRRTRIAQAIHEAGHNLEFINGGGTGSLLTTREESSVTEVTIGSGFFAPHLFDHYKDFKLTPALAFTLPVIRRPAVGLITCMGGGYVASGAVEKIKSPSPYLPEGLKLLKHEGAGEVQTPFKNTQGHEFSIGDLVIMRHAKAGEPCERFNEIIGIREGEIVTNFLTYRGEGQCFL